VYGKEIVIRVQPYGFVQFRGNVAEISAHPTTIAGQRSWLVKLTAQDVIADLGRYHPRGVHQPNSSGWDNRAVYWGTTDFWDATLSPWQVLNTGDGAGGPAPALEQQLITRGLVAGVGAARNWPDVGGSGSAYYMINGATGEDYGSSLEIIQRLYRLVKGGHINWNPATRRIEQGYPAAGGLLALVYTGGKIIIRPQAGDAAYPPFTIDAATAIVDEPEAYQTVAENITVIEIVGGNMAYQQVTRPNAPAPASGTDVAWVQAAPDSEVYVYTVPGSNNTVTTRLTLDLQIASSLSGGLVSAMDGLNAEWNPWVQSINGKMRTPDVTFDLERWNYGEAFERMILTLMSDRRPVFFSGSEYAELGAMARQHQIIGGRVGYKGGYYAKTKLAPAGTSATPTQLTIGQLVTNPTPTMGDYDPSITLADWGTVSIGAA